MNDDMPPAAWQMPDADTKTLMGRLTDLIQVLTLDYPALVPTVERAIRRLITEHRRQAIAERLERLDGSALEEIDTVIGIIERARNRSPDERA